MSGFAACTTCGETNINYSHFPQEGHFGGVSKAMANHKARVYLIPLTRCVVDYKLL